MAKSYKLTTQELAKLVTHFHNKLVDEPRRVRVLEVEIERYFIHIDPYINE
jgi:hypothetical protein